MPLLTETSSGLWCAAGRFHIDPWEPVDRAVITHAHGDHARPGSSAYLCAVQSVPLLRRRFGADTIIEPMPYGEPKTLGDVRLSFHPAGHILGSAQVRIESGDGVWVVAGDYKRAADPTCEPFEVVRCDTFITSYAVVGDGAETSALVLDQVAVETRDDLALAEWVEQRILPLRELDPAAQQACVSGWWGGLDRLQRFLLLKIVTGELRVGVSQTLVVRALAQAAGLPVTTIAARIMGEWAPTADWFTDLLSHERTDDDRSRPYPFFLASPLEEPVAALGPREDWIAEWKWDGIRAQIVRRAGAAHLWSRGEELITHRFPEIAAAATRLPDGTVLDGEVLGFRDGRPLPFSALQQRIERQKQVAQMVRAVPAVFMAYDLLEDEGIDRRSRPPDGRSPPEARATRRDPRGAADIRSRDGGKLE